MTSDRAKQQFRIVLIKPSHYDDDGYVIQWFRSAVPSNTLAAMYGLSQQVINSSILGDDIEPVIDAYDETNHRIREAQALGISLFAGMWRRIKADPAAFDYTDTALSPVADSREENLDLLQSK